MIYYTYEIVNSVNGKVYYGKTIDLESRWYQHRYAACHGNELPIYRAMRKYGIDNFKMKRLAEHVDNDAASKHECLLIASSHFVTCYNIAKGGNGGHTMTSDQLNAQYVIKTCDHETFLRMFHDGQSVREIMQKFDVSRNAVNSCAIRLNVSFAARRASRKIESKPKHKRRQINAVRAPRIRMTPEERYEFRSSLMTSVNKLRGVSDELKHQIVSLYFYGEQLTAKEIAKKLSVSHGSVRSVVSTTYAEMSLDERILLKKQRASTVRSGKRNPNSLTRRKVGIAKLLP